MSDSRDDQRVESGTAPISTASRSRAFRVIAALITLSLLVAVVLAMAARRSVVAQVTAELKVDQPTVEMSTSGSRVWTPATATLAMNEGDSVRTGVDGRATLTYFEGSTTNILPSTRLVVTTTGRERGGAGGTFLELGQSLGRAWHNVKKLASPDSTFEVKTPSATAAVRGTSFGVEVAGSGACTISVEVGTVAVTTKTGDSVLVADGQKVVVGADGTISAEGMQALTDADMSGWETTSEPSADAGQLLDAGPTAPAMVEGAGSGGGSSLTQPQQPAAAGSTAGNSPPDVAWTAKTVSVAVGEEVATRLSASDPDGDRLVFSASDFVRQSRSGVADYRSPTDSGAGLPDGASLDSGTGVFRWRPGADQASTYRIRFFASDGLEKTPQYIVVIVSGP